MTLRILFFMSNMFIMLFYVYWAIILALPLTEDGKPMNGVLCSDSFSALSSNLSGQYNQVKI